MLLGLPSAPGPSTCLMHPTWAGDLFHPEGSGGEGGGRGDRDGEYMYIHGWVMSMYDKNHYNIVISLQLIKKKN